MTLHIRPPNPAQSAPESTAEMRQTCVLRLVDRRSGALYRVNGAVLLVFSSAPQEAARELLQNRDPALWQVLTDPLPITHSALETPHPILA